jgi:hypothetical protein
LLQPPLLHARTLLLLLLLLMHCLLLHQPLPTCAASAALSTH